MAQTDITEIVRRERKKRRRVNICCVIVLVLAWILVWTIKNKAEASLIHPKYMQNYNSLFYVLTLNDGFSIMRVGVKFETLQDCVIVGEKVKKKILDKYKGIKLSYTCKGGG